MWSRPARRARGAGLGLATCAVLLVLMTPVRLGAGDSPPVEIGAEADDRAPQSTPPARSAEPPQEAEAAVVPAPRGEPARVVIPALDVDVQLVRLGLASDGSMQVPDRGFAGWYVEGPRPGHDGPAVIAAHVDSRVGPDVFYRLHELAPGDQVHVTYDSGDEVTFVVASSVQTPKDALPVEDIWPLTNERLLTLITCGGDFDRSVGHYRDNVIVYTTPLGPAPNRPRPLT